MAFNPFHGFRKHRKVMFAGLTILCMGTFILAGNSSKGDFFDWFFTMTGSSGRYPKVASLYGATINLKDIQELREQRVLANEYMRACVDRAYNNIRIDVDKALEKTPYRDQVRQIAQFAHIPGFASQFLGQLTPIRHALERQGKKDEANLIVLLETMIYQIARLPANGTYFGGDVSVEGLLDFKIWLHQADRMGIELNKAGVEEEVRRETLGKMTALDASLIEKVLLRNMRGAVAPETLLAGLANEFRARLAQATLVGSQGGDLERVPADVTPYEFWDFYRNQRSEVMVQVLPLAVSDFVAEVKEKPTEAELRKYFDDYKNQEFQPDRPEPGFKEPRRVQIEWVSARSDLPHYQKAAEIGLHALQATLPLSLHAALLNQYEGMRRTHFLAPSWTDPWTVAPFPLHESSVYNATGIAGVVADVIGQTALRDSPLATIAAVKASAIAREFRDRVRLGVTLLSQADPMGGVVAAAVAYDISPREEFLPLRAVRAQVAERYQEQLARDLVTHNLNTVKKELDALKGKPEKVRVTEARRYLAEAFLRYGLKHATTTEPRDRYTIAEDTGLQPLKDSYLRNRSQDVKAKMYPDIFLGAGKLYEPEKFPTERSFQGAADDFIWQADPEPFLYWKTGDKPAYVPTFQDSEKKVLAAWLFDKARALAQAKAQEIEEKARKAKGDPVPVFTDSTKHPERMFPLFGISRLVPRRSAMFGGPKQYDMYHVPDDRIEFPPGDFVEKALTLKEKGDVLTIADNPKRNYYVVALLSRLEPSVNEFYLKYKEAGAGAMQQDSLYDLFEREKRALYREQVLAQLRRDARLEIDPEQNKPRENRAPIEEAN